MNNKRVFRNRARWRVSMLDREVLPGSVVSWTLSDPKLGSLYCGFVWITYDISMSTPLFIRLAQSYVLQHHQQFLGEEQKFDITYGSGGNWHRPIMDS